MDANVRVVREVTADGLQQTYRPILDLENFLCGLGWMGEASSEHVRRLWLPDRTERTVRETMNRLVRDELVERRAWFVPRPKVNGKKQGPVLQEVLWSLGKRGRELVKDRDAFPPATLAPRHTKLLAHDTQTYEIIVRMIELARPFGLSGVYLEREARLDPPRRRPIMDAFVSLRFLGGGVPDNVVPWTKDKSETEEVRLRYAIENDRNSEPGSVIKAKADAYIRSGNEQWFKLYSRPFPVVVWLVPTETRLRFVLEAWREVWPQGTWYLTTDEWMKYNRWVFYHRGTVRERPLFVEEQ
ncbi:MAG: hypothetical protein RLZZ387_1245 [Chloroflexota bacterium]|jgi:hypothetical protein